MSPDRNQAISRSAPRLRSSSSIRCCFQPSSFLNPWYWKSLDQLEQLDTLGRISSGELCQRPMQCWHRGYDRSAAANRSSILDKHLETLSTLSFFFSPFFLFSLPSRFSYSTHSKRVTVFTLSRIVSTIRRFSFLVDRVDRVGNKKKKKITEKRWLSLHRFHIFEKEIEEDRVPIHRRGKETWMFEKMKRSASFSVFRKDLWPPCYWRVYHRHLPPPFSLPPPLALFLTLNPRFCLQFESGHRGGGFRQIIAFSVKFARSFIISLCLFITYIYIYIFLILIGNSFLSIEALINFKLSREKFISFITFLSVLFIRSVSFISNSEKYLLLYRLCKKLHSLRLNILNDYYSIIKWRNSKNGILDRVTKDI